ncbi:MAG: acetylxylan esterase [Bacteroidales bacterium]|jgi:cephalosporin-C deacetylase|nr:acetylxylan esterase [Bacteroidales bacterium]
MKRILTLLLFVALFVCANSQTNYQYRIVQTSDWVYYSPQNPTIEIVVKNSDGVASQILKVNVSKDTKEHLYFFSQTVSVPKGDSSVVQFTFNVEPGFYRVNIAEDNAPIKDFNIGYEPTKIISPADNQPDFKEFWNNAKQELAQVDPEYKVIAIKDTQFNNKARKLYLVKMKSLGGVEIEGFYSVPAKKGVYPAEIHYMGYDSKPWIPGGYDDRIEFVLSTRNQGLLKDTDRDNMWLTWGLDNKDHYYYRGAFMDLIRAIDFIASRPEVDNTRIVAEGGSQGGAFTLAAAALDSRLKAIAPSVPFLSDYPDYFKIVDWPGNWLMDKQREIGMTDEDFYKTLSYFDIKNFAGWITCPVLMCVGLQDDICPPHTNFSGYNLIKSEKYYNIYPNQAHSAGLEWWNAKEEFLKRHIYAK